MKYARLMVALVTVPLIVASCNYISQRNIEKQQRKQRMELLGALNRISASSELVTAETTVSKIMTAKDLQWYGDRKLAYSCTATLKAGLDLRGLQPSDMDFDQQNSTVTLTVPHAKLLTFNLPAENIHQEYFDKDITRSDFTLEERQRIKIVAENSIRKNVARYGLLEEAEANARIIFTGIFTQLGVENVYVNFK